ncbi:MAG TPA: HAMP domain-containing sensor histidine kinase [Candidatus Sulfotelmatobacter sp.]|jgi:signal transduction histidine kinase|nr:HAMP domain-containing sensor histidine kinase [Candidatus Sulfotelmatobacter sp.]
MPRNLRTTAAWRISIWTTVAFALGTAGAFSIVYFLVAQGLRDRSDTWLSGEADVLAQVSADTPSDHLYNRIVSEVAELATQEVPDERTARGERLNSVFFLAADPNNSEAPLWVGPGSKDAFVKAIRQANLVPGPPKSITVEGYRQAFRVVEKAQNGRTVWLGLSDHGARHVLHTLARRFLMVWGGMFLLGFVISYWSARRTLHRVEKITETVARIGTEGLEERLPEPVNSDEISRLAKTFNNMLDRLQASVNQLRTVTGGIAHDLKSPVTLIRGTLESALCNEGNDKWRDSVGEAVENLDKLLQLLNTTLDLAEAEAGALHIDRGPVDFSDVVKQLVDIYQPAMAEHHHEVTADVEENVIVDADVTLLNRVVSNLLENELTHLPAGCQVKIRLYSDQGSALLVVEDNGPGFPADIAGRLFKRFVRGKQSPGHGLGLAFVDAVAQAHGGGTQVSERPGGGAVVTLSLPVSVLQAA